MMVKRFCFIALLTGIALSAWADSNEGEDGIVTLKSGHAAIAIDTQKGGKVLSLKYDDKEVISQSRFPESFGSTFWTSPQKEWNWPPVSEFDKQPYQVKEQIDKRLVIASSTSQRLGMSVAKDFSLGKQDGSFVVTYSIKNEGSEARSVAPWEITRVPNAEGLIFFEAVDSIWPAGLMTFTEANGASWYATDDAQQNRKINADGKGWLAFAGNGLLLVKAFDNLKAGEPAPGEAEIQVYVNRGKSFIELESQGAYKLLQPGESLSWTVRWFLTPTTETQPSASLVKAVKKLIK